MYLIRKALKECKREIKSVLNMNANVSIGNNSFIH